MLVVIPVGQAATGNPNGLWAGLTYVLDLFVVVTMVWWPWHIARWARRLRRRLAIEQPHAIVSIVEVWLEGEETVRLGVLLANSSGLTFFDSPASSVTIGWSEIAAVNIVEYGHMNRESLHVTTTDGLLATRFVPLGRAGINALGAFRFADFVSAVRGTGADVVEGR